MYKIMFPFLEQQIKAIYEDEDLTSAQKLDNLIDLLSSEVLNMDLGHIKGENIVNNDHKHLNNFLELLLELSKLYRQQQEEQGENDDEDE